ncbi:Iterative polyketide synthase afoE [Aspergillus mulundensis]|uniref:Iterative polyketide synthase afoE n=1 Tax=Aspergillus mulundensis TaxID=1810919 RepID=A0A3D8RRI4_9EURO|nr:Iterative polyketide synthase afoE [Aspergillus mulundensis]RDW76683.1 Iterative polyketide synthase afoE [Aspergillus mulundensis]
MTRSSTPGHDASASTIFLFGPHVGTFTKASMDKLVEPLSTSPQRDWILSTIADLPTYWDALAAKMPDVARDIDGPGCLSALDSWLRHGIEQAGLSVPDDENLPSILVGPLVVLIQLTQYWRHLEMIRDDATVTPADLQAELVQQAKNGGKQTVILGFCAGLLAALSVASASTQASFEEYGAVAVRLAMLIGALIDAQEVWDKASGKGSSASYAVAWRGQKQEDDMNRITSELASDAYVAVRYDQTRATVTASETIAPLLMKRLKAAGITVAEVGIKGQIHSPNADRRGHTDALVELCASMAGLQYADVKGLALTTYDNTGTGRAVSGEGSMTEMVVRSILVQQCQWFDTFSAVADAHEDPYVVTFGLERCVPPTLMRSLGGKQVFYEDLPKDPKKPSFWVQPSPSPSPQQHPIPVQPTQIEPIMPVSRQSEPIAIVGMSIKTAGANDLSEFVEMLKTGESQHIPITRDRLMHDMLFRENADADPKRQFYGCFFSDGDAFDHKFFKRSPREAAAMDPQSRIVLQAAYQAVEQSGYFSESHAGYTPDGRDKMHVGVYLGSCGVDYEHNISCYDPNAFTATGALKSFITGRVSHHFGWTGPCMTFDTACSSSAVAIHTACRNLLSGECTAALAGGSNTVTNMNWFQNLAAGSFVSPTGQCKPFDDGADGYCRAEGAAFVYLKRLSDAVRDGNQVIATIAASAVYQNENCTPLFVPNSPSLSHLFKDVMRQARVTANDVSLVEAHGTGTPVGDPAEYESILAALGGPGRTKKLPIGSVKGHIGHTEGASGAIALVKIIMMMRDGFIPPQASFKTMNKKIPVKADDNIEVVTKLRSWDGEKKTALLNNYGACGSNASMIVMQPDKPQPLKAIVAGARYPFWLPGLDTRAIAAYCAKLGPWLRSCKEEPSLADVSFNLNRQSNRSLPQGFVFNARSLSELHEKLEQAVAAAPSSKDAAASVGIAPVKAERPVILCFGGQISRFVGLNRGLFDSVAVLRKNLDAVDNVVKAQGLQSIYAAPDIFSREAVQDTVKLQTMLFAMQYACARAWIDCGLDGKIQAVVGHSFGEITALCVAGTLSLDDTVRLVAARAKLVRDSWGADSGAMMAVEGDEALVRQLLSEANQAGSDGSASIACYNGPRSFTIAGSTPAVDQVQQTISTPKFSSIKGKRLNVTNAFHSSLVDKITDDLETIGKTLAFNKPVIHVERATEVPLAKETDASFVAQHMRQPVFFNHAVQRLAKKHPQAIFLEAGSSSTITVMAGRAISQGQNSSDGHSFQAVNITNDTGFDSLADTTTALWKQGLRVAFWPHHSVQTPEYAHLLLPPYQFDTSSRHWLPMKSPLEKVKEEAAKMVATGGTLSAPHQDTAQDPRTMPLWDFVGYQDDTKQARFRINTASDKYNRYVLTHVIAQTAPICPGTLECDIVIEALFSLDPTWRGLSPVVKDMVNHSPICKDPSRTVYLDLTASNKKRTAWAMKITSVDSASHKSSGSEVHAEATVELRSPSDPAHTREFANFERLVSHKQCTDLLRLNLSDADDGVEVLQGRNVYRAFSPIVDYGEVYRGLKFVVGKGTECAGRVQLPRSSRGDTWLDVPLSDSFSQVGGVWVNLMTDLPGSDMFIATGCEVSMRSPRVVDRADVDVWHVYARHSWQGEKSIMTDLFVFEAATGQLVEIMLGVQYMRVARASMSMMLARMTKDESVLRTKVQAPAQAVKSATETETKTGPKPVEVKSKAPKKEKKPAKKAKPSKPKSSKPSGWRDITDEVRDLVATVSGIDAGELELDADMADFGIDSLMGMELGKEVESAFKCPLDQNEQMEATTLRKFVRCVSNALFGPNQGAAEEGEEESDDSSSEELSESDEDSAESSDTGILTPTPEEEVLPLKAVAIHKAAGLSAVAPPVESRLALTPADILASFGQVKLNTDSLMKEYGVDKTEGVMLSGSNRLCAALVVEAMDELGSPLRTASPGQVLERVPFLPQHTRLMQWVYEFLERDARLINIDPASGQITRTHIGAPRKDSTTVLQEVLSSDPGFAVPNRLAYYAGRQLAGVLSGTTDGIRVLFGSPEGRELTAAMYCEHTFNCMSYEQMREVTKILAERIGHTGETLKVLEMGAGTGGTTLVMAPFLATLAESLPIEYTFTDISPSMVANARRRFSKLYPFMRFAVHDIEKAPADELRSQHLVLASNAIHATHNLGVSLSNIHQALRPDGFLMMLEMTEVVPFVDLVFGLLEGWWLFDDGRHHAVVPAEHWEAELHKAGYGHVDWTDGNLPENSFQKVIIALASGSQGPRLPKPEPVETPIPELNPENIETRTANAESLVHKYTTGWETPKLRILDNQTQQATTPRTGKSLDAVVIVTGATGSLGSHIVQKLTETPSVATVVCLNRRSSSSSPEKRQHEALTTRGISLSPAARAKLRILETDTSKPQLGLPPLEYSWLLEHATDIIHNAWPMSGTRPVSAFETQLQVMRNLLDLAREIASRPFSKPSRVGFQFISSIGVVGFCGKSVVPEERVPLSATLPSGYGEAKWICERMIDETLHKHPKLFRAMAVRPGQISGSSVSGFWNPVEHFAFLVKSAQSLRAWPALRGQMQWIPVDYCAGGVVDLLHLGSRGDDAHPVYHIDNPVGQEWTSMNTVLAEALGIPERDIMPFKSWISRVRRSPLPTETENPAARLVDFLDDHFERMSCGGLVLDTKKAVEHSGTMAGVGPVGAELARKYVLAWRGMGYLA